MATGISSSTETKVGEDSKRRGSASLKVSSVASYEQVRRSSPARSKQGNLSFNPVESWIGPSPLAKPVIALDVSKSKRILQVAVAVFYCFFSSGIVFGYAAIKPVLIKEGAYSDYCTSEAPASRLHTCYEQEIRLNFMFAAAAVATNVFALPVGTILDKYGPRISSIAGSVLLAIGAVLLAFTKQLAFDGYLPGYIFLALGGTFIFLPSYQLSNTFPKNSGFILALLTGAFDSSSAIFLFYRLIYTASGNRFGPQKFFVIYLIIPLLILISQIFLMPSDSYKSIGEIAEHAKSPSSDWGNGEGEPISQAQEARVNHTERAMNEYTSLLANNSNHINQREEERKREICGVWGALHGKSALQQVKTPWFILITLFTVFQMMRINYFVATVRTQYEYLLHSQALAKHVSHVFDVALPAGGVISIPFIGLILDNFSTTFVLGLLVVFPTIIGVVGVLPFNWAAYTNIALFVFYRPLYYTAVSDYAAKVFGFYTFGKVYGLMICFAGALNLLQTALDMATHKVFHGDPIPVNVTLLTIVLLIGSTLTGYVWQKSRASDRERLEEEAEVAPEVLIPEPNCSS